MSGLTDLDLGSVIAPPVPAGSNGHGPAPVTSGAWPMLDPAALHGPVGSFVLSCSPHTEADPAALLVTTLVIVGNNLNRGDLCGGCRFQDTFHFAEALPEL